MSKEVTLEITASGEPGTGKALILGHLRKELEKLGFQCVRDAHDENCLHAEGESQDIIIKLQTK